MFPEDEEDGTPEMGELESPPSSVELSEDEVPPTDITFECPHCAKSLSIDPRGAGLVIQCVQCGKPVTVPIPEGLEIEDFDASPDEISIQLLHARQNLAKCQVRITEMEQEIDELRTFRENALRINEERAVVRERIRVQLATVCKMQEEAYNLVSEVIGIAAEQDSP